MNLKNFAADFNLNKRSAKRDFRRLNFIFLFHNTKKTDFVIYENKMSL